MKQHTKIVEDDHITLREMNWIKFQLFAEKVILFANSGGIYRLHMSTIFMLVSPRLPLIISNLFT